MCLVDEHHDEERKQTGREEQETDCYLYIAADRDPSGTDILATKLRVIVQTPGLVTINGDVLTDPPCQFPRSPHMGSLM